MHIFWRFSVAVLVAVVVTACASSKPKGEILGEVNTLYNNAMDEVQAGNYQNAVHVFEELERQHPYSQWATKAQQMVAYAHFRDGKMEEADVAIDRFVRLHPGHKDLPYMYYLKGLSYYYQISDVKRDQGYTKKALRVFETLVARFPSSEYAADAKLKITLCRDHLAAKEIDVGRFYQKETRYLAAINRFKSVVKNYETSTQTPEALYRMVESYLALGIDDEAKRVSAILGYNYSDNEWYKKAYALMTEKQLLPAGQEKGLFGQMKKGIQGVFE